MTLRHRFTLRSVAAGTVLGLTAGTAVVLGSVAPASAATIGFDCTVPVVGAKTFAVDVTTNAPATIPAGTSVKPTVTSVMTVPADLADTMRFFFAPDAIGGTIEATTLVDGAPVPTTITIPRTTVPSSGAIVLKGTGKLPAITAGAVGTSHQIAAGSQDVGMTLYKGTTGSPFDIPCSPSAGQDTVISTITASAVPVAPVSSVTRVKAAYGARTHVAKAVATITAGKPVSGSVVFTLKRGSQVLKRVTVTVAGGRATAVFKNLRRKGKHTVTASYRGSKTVRASVGTTAFTIR